VNNNLTSFTVDSTYTNDQIRFALQLENLGGIRPSVDAQRNLRHVAVMSAAEDSGRLTSENPYHDRIENDVLIYTAQGREGNQALVGRNKRLLEQYASPIPLFGFVNIGMQVYRFLGLLELLRHYQEIQADSRGDIRKVWLFEFRIHRRPEIVPVESAAVISASILSESRITAPLDNAEREVVTHGDNETTEPGLFDVESIRIRLFQFSPYEFEQFIKLVLERSGFTNVSITRASRDGGIDANAYVDDRDEFFAGTHLQAQIKRWRHAVGSPEINNFRGALNTAAKGVFITTSHSTRAAAAEARHTSKPSIALLDGTRLAGVVIRNRIFADV
jgi:HJR/Mrr/RecB family endonuclease